MGLLPETAAFEKHIFKRLGIRLMGLRMCELGNQMLMGSMGRGAAKFRYCSHGAIHVSIDWNGKSGAIPFDLQKPLPRIFHRWFQVVTDYGTLEHVQTQYPAWKNVHQLCAYGGIMIHVLPLIGRWHGHGLHHFSQEIMDKIGKACSYQIIENTIIPSSKVKPQVATVYRKTRKSTFPSKEIFDKIEIPPAT